MIKRIIQYFLVFQVAEIFRTLLQIQKSITFKRVGRVLTGPEIGGSHPVIVTFSSFNEREMVWRRAGMLAGTSMFISEDVHKYVFTNCLTLLYL